MRSVFFAITLLSGAGVGLQSGVALAQQNEASALTVNIVKPVERQWPDSVPASGWLKPWHEAIIASETSGLRISEVLVDVGSVVVKGQPLVRLANETVQADLRKEEASVASAKAELAKARANAQRARQVQGSGALSDEKVTEYLYSEQTAVADLDSAEAALDSQKIKLSQTTIVAADDGLITSRSAKLGDVVSSGTELFRLLRQQRVEWQAEVSANYLPQIKEGLTATIAGPGGQQVTGTVRLVGPTVATDTGRAIIYVALPTEAHPPVGLYASGEIDLRTAPALTIPETALVFRDGISYVFTVGNENRVTRLKVETGRREGDDVEIVSGLDPAARVVKAGGAFLSNNALVTIAEDAR